VAALLVDRTECEFIGVTIAEQMSFEETIRLTETLKRLKVPMHRLLINNVVPEQSASACDFCATRRRAEDRVIARFRQHFGRALKVFIAQQQPREVRGREQLRAHFDNWHPLVREKATKPSAGRKS
jgi:anion-transporting  ArsA/GET3 family ATPase